MQYSGTGDKPKTQTPATTPAAPPTNRYYTDLAAQPLPTQGYVADLVDMMSTYQGELPKEDKKTEDPSGMTALMASLNTEEDADAVRRGKAERKAQSYVEKKLGTELTPPSPDELLFTWQHSPQGMSGMAGQAPPPEDLLARWMAEHPENPSESFVGRMWQGMQADKVEDRMIRREALGTATATGERKAPAPRPEVTRMTWDEYNALSDTQRAAVDFNSALVQAIRKDRRLRKDGTYDDVTEDDRSAYDARVTSMFGEEGGSPKFSPETVAVLDQIDWSDAAGDLDDFLSLRAAVDTADLKNLKKFSPDIPRFAYPQPGEDVEIAPPPGLEGAEAASYELSRELAMKTDLLTRTMAAGNKLLQTFRASAQNNRNEYVDYIGGQLNETPTTLGFGATKDDATVQTIFNNLMNPEGVKTREDAQAMLAAVAEHEPHLVKPFWDYYKTRTEQISKYGLPTARSPEIKYRDIQQLNELLGLGKG